MATQFVDNMADQQNSVDGESACGDAHSWKDRKCNIALITGITGQVNAPVRFSCHNRYCANGLSTLLGTVHAEVPCMCGRWRAWI